MAVSPRLCKSPLLRGALQRSATRRCAVLTRHLSPRTTMTQAMHNSSSSSDSSEVLYSTDAGGGVASLLLNRPKALHALNINMIRLLSQGLKKAENDMKVKMVVLEGQGEKAFCAGGDIRAVTEAGKVGERLAQDFFREEYTLNYYTGNFSKPYLAILDGITMGGGVGISVHAPFRVATENTLFAMPETAIGLFPDVGGSFFLPRLKGHLGMYLALTGYRLKSRDVQFAEVATHFIPRSEIPALKDRLSSLCADGGNENTSSDVKKELDKFHQQNVNAFPQDGFSLAPHLNAINRCFNQSSIEEILEALRQEETEWADKQLKTLSRMSPTALKVTHHQLMMGKEWTFSKCLIMEYRMSQACMARHDFYEGVRAVIVDKDNSPQWSPPTLEEVTQDIVLGHFAPLTADTELQIE